MSSWLCSIYVAAAGTGLGHRSQVKRTHLCGASSRSPAFQLFQRLLLVELALLAWACTHCRGPVKYNRNATVHQHQDQDSAGRMHIMFQPLAREDACG